VIAVILPPLIKRSRTPSSRPYGATTTPLSHSPELVVLPGHGPQTVLPQPLHHESLLVHQQAVDALVDPVPVEFAREFQVSTIYHPLPDDFLNQAVAESLKLPAYVWRGALAGCLAVDFTPDLARIQAPVLLLRGDQDAVFPRAGQDALVTRLARAVLRVYHQTGHAIHWERPEQVVQDLKDFIIYSLDHKEVAHGNQS
jgi:pimeloyl-ACP methyl ester carboxylesterase